MRVYIAAVIHGLIIGVVFAFICAGIVGFLTGFLISHADINLSASMYTALPALFIPNAIIAFFASRLTMRLVQAYVRAEEFGHFLLVACLVFLVAQMLTWQIGSMFTEKPGVATFMLLAVVVATMLFYLGTVRAFSKSSLDLA